MALVVALGLMTGVQSELRDRIVGSTAHVYVYRVGTFEGQDINHEIEQLMIPGVAGAAPAVVGKGLMESTVVDATPVDLKGIDPAREGQVTDIRSSIQSGSLEALTSRRPEQKDGVILGVDLAKNLRVSVGDLVYLLTQSLVVGPGTASPRTRGLEVVGIAKFGIYQTDSFQAFVTLQTAEQMLGRSTPDLIQLKLNDLEQAPKISRQLEEKLGLKYSIEDWTEINGPLYSALWLEKVAISLTIGLIVMVAALNIVASLVLLVMEKSRDIAILRTMGAPARAIRRIFIFQGLTIGLIGTISGTILGLIVCYFADKYKLIHLQSDVYQITYLPFRVRPFDLVIVVVSAVAVCLIATIYPSRQAGRLDPAEALRNQ
jgi:lipoprotein-releasing system permease protein